MTNEELIKKIETQIDFEKKSESEYNIGRRDAYTNVLILFKQLEEPKITEEQAWKIIAKSMNRPVMFWENMRDDYLNSLKEPELPVIPQFVASAIEKTRETRKNISISNIFYEVTNSGFYTEIVDSWILSNSNLFTIAWFSKDGYTIEKEPEKLYRVKFPNVTKHGNEMYLDKNGGEDVTSIDWSPKDFVENEDSDDYVFTEQEIKAIDERYLAFAEEVTE